MTWQDHAACKGMDTRLFFPPERIEGGHSKASRRQYTEARQVCFRCPVRLSCLEQAEADGDHHYGMFGGLMPTERKRLRVGLQRPA